MEDRRCVVFCLRVDSEALVRRPGSVQSRSLGRLHNSRRLRGRRELKPDYGPTCRSDVGLLASMLLPAPGNPKHDAREGHSKGRVVYWKNTQMLNPRRDSGAVACQAPFVPA